METPIRCDTHMEYRHGDTCPRCNQTVVRDQLGRDITPPRDSARYITEQLKAGEWVDIGEDSTCPTEEIAELRVLNPSESFRIVKIEEIRQILLV